MKAALSVAIILVTASPLLGADIYVSPDGQGDGSRLNPAKLQYALNLAASNMDDDTLWLRRGQYDASTTTFLYQSPADSTWSLTLSGGWDDTYTVRATSPSYTRLNGGGQNRVMKLVSALARQDFTVKLKYLTIEAGKALGTEEGAGILAFNTGGGTLRLVLEDCWLRDNTAVGGPGGAVSANCPFEATGCQFVGNQAPSGGALLLKDRPGGNQTQAALISQCMFSNNLCGAGGRGAAIESWVSPTILLSTIRGPTDPLSTSGPGGTVYAGAGSTLTVTSSVFRECRTDDAGAAIRIESATATIESTLFTECRAGQSVGGGRGAVFVYQSAPVNFRSCTFAGCRSLTDSGGAILSNGASPTAVNTIFWSCGSQSYLNLTPTLNVATAATCYTDASFAAGSITDGGGNVEGATVDPFVGGGDLHPGAGSPVLDAGDGSVPLTALDADGLSRVVDGDGDGTPAVDLGALERQPNVEAGADAFDFARVPVLTLFQVALNIRNSGSEALDVGQLAIVSDALDEFSITVDPCSGQSLEPGGQCTVQLGFRPQVIGVRTATLEIPSNDPDTPKVQVALTGEGVAAPTLSPAMGTFGTEVTIQYSELGERKGKVEIRPAASPLDLRKVKVLSWTEVTIKVLVSKKLAPGPYEFVVRPRDEPRVISVEGFTYVGPRVDTVDRTEGLPGDTVTVSGAWFGYKRAKAKLLFEYVDRKGKTRRKKCRTIRKSRLWDPFPGTSSLRFRLPKLSGTTGRLILRTVLGEPIAAPSFTIR